MQTHSKPRTQGPATDWSQLTHFVQQSGALAFETILHGRKIMLCRVVFAVAVLLLRLKWGNWGPSSFASRCTKQQNRSGGARFTGGECDFSKFIRDGFSPQHHLNRLLVLKWQGKGGSGGKKLRRNSRLFLLESAAIAKEGGVVCGETCGRFIKLVSLMP